MNICDSSLLQSCRDTQFIFDTDGWLLFHPSSQHAVKVSNLGLHVFLRFLYPDFVGIVKSEWQNNFFDSLSVKELTPDDFDTLINTLFSGSFLQSCHGTTASSNDVNSLTFSSFPPNPKRAAVHISTRCNLQCTYCYNSSDRNSMNSDEHSAAEWEKVFSDLISFGISEFDITGGEPLLRKDLLPVYKSLKSGGAKVSLLTNGTLINCIDDAALIKESFTDVYLSIDSHIASVNDRYRGNGSYALATNAAKLLSLCGIEWTAKAVFQPDNVGPLYDVRDYVLGLGAKKFDVSLLSGQCADDLSMAAVVYALYCERMSNASLEKLSADFNDRKFGNPCAAARSEIAIDASGEVYPCRSLLSSEMRCGNLYDSTISFIWNNSSVLAQIRNIDFNNINGCKKCSLLRLCLGGCRAIAYQNCNSLNGYIGHYYCALYKRRILNNIRKMVNRQIL